MSDCENIYTYYVENTFVQFAFLRYNDTMYICAQDCFDNMIVDDNKVECKYLTKKFPTSLLNTIRYHNVAKITEKKLSEMKFEAVCEIQYSENIGFPENDMEMGAQNKELGSGTIYASDAEEVLYVLFEDGPYAALSFIKLKL